MLTAILPILAVASVQSYDLVGTRTCLAGSWGEHSTVEWRVQLGLYNDAAHADAIALRFQKRGIAAETWIAAWLAGDAEPEVVVTPALHDRAAAEKLARRLGHHSFARAYTVWSH